MMYCVCKCLCRVFPLESGEVKALFMVGGSRMWQSYIESAFQNIDETHM